MCGKGCGLLPTPNAVAWKNYGYDYKLCLKRAEKHQTDIAMVAIMGNGWGKIAIKDLEWIMGWPSGQTELDSPAMEWFRNSRPPRGKK